MKNQHLTRRRFLTAGSTAAVLAAISSEVQAVPSAGDLGQFIVTFDDAWARHDAQALATLHTEDVIVVNRYGSMLEGWAELEKALQFLHGSGGPFKKMSFPPQQILTTRSLGATMAAIHTKRKNPEMGTGDQLKNGGSDMKWVDMIATYLLVQSAGGWQIKQHDLHNVDAIQFPFATKWNR